MQRNGQNPIKVSKTYDHNTGKLNGDVTIQTRSTNIAGICPKCQTEVSFKPGFRFSSLKCSKCGSHLKKP